ncbi:MAG: twin-arginine translocase TatA/TatE family subunit [Bryobacteraceae bacterium]
MGPVGWQEMIIIFLVALVLFGPKKLPELGRNLGKALTEFRRATNDLKSTFEREMQTLERETDSLKTEANKFVGDIHDSYDSGYYDAYHHAEDTLTGETATNPTTVSASAVQGAEPSVQAITDSSEYVAETTPAEEVSVSADKAEAPQGTAVKAAEGTVARESGTQKA